MRATKRGWAIEFYRDDDSDLRLVRFELVYWGAGMSGQETAPAVDVASAWVEKAMEQAQVFASSWSLLGSRFAGENQHADALAEKACLRAMLTDAQAALAAKGAAHEKQLNACKSLIASLERQRTTLREGAEKWSEAVKSLLSEREANAVLTSELAGKDAEIACLQSDLARPESLAVGLMRAEISQLQDLNASADRAMARQEAELARKDSILDAKCAEIESLKLRLLSAKEPK